MSLREPDAFGFIGSQRDAATMTGPNPDVPSSERQTPRTARVSGCPLCGAEGGAVLFQASDRLAGTPGIYTYRRCGECHTVYQDPVVVPEDLPLCYSHTYYENVLGVPCGAETEEMRRRPYRSVAVPQMSARQRLGDAIVAAVQGRGRNGAGGLVARWLANSRLVRERAFRHRGNLPDELLPQKAQPGRALDIGCGPGILLRSLTTAGWDAEGVEWDTSVAAVARGRTGRPVFVGDFRRIELPLASYEVVVLSHVFEHLEDPVHALKRVSSLLTRGGRAALFYPNPDSLGSRWFGAWWMGWDPPRHLVLPPVEAITRAAKLCGLRVVTRRTRPTHAKEVFAMSRLLRAVGEGPHVQPRPWTGRGRAGWDAMLLAIESVLVWCGCSVGEEIVLTLSAG